MLEQKLRALEELQKVDVAIAELERSGAEHPKKLAEIEGRLDAARGVLEAEQGRITELERQKKAMEDELANAKDRVKKWEARLTEQRSTREYTALAREIDILKKQNVTAGETILELAAQIETARTASSDKVAAQKDQSDKLVAEAREIRKAMDELSSRKKALAEKRDAAAKGVDATMLRRYETIKKKRTNPVAAVVGGACKGCNMNLPPQMYNELRTAKKLDVCPSCGRMIYAVEAFEQPASVSP